MCHRITSPLLLLLLTIALSACEAGNLPSSYSYERHPQRYEVVAQPLDTLTFDNCANDAALEQSFSRTVEVKETVTLDQAEAQRVAVQAGISNVVEIMGALEMEISRQFGAGLENGASESRETVVYINPNRKATVFLTWIETWEYGSFATFKDSRPLGEVSYKLLKEAKLDSRVESFRCGWMGDLELQITEGWEQFTNNSQVQDLWSNRRLEVLATIAGVVLLILLLLLWRARSRRHQDDFDLG